MFPLCQAVFELCTSNVVQCVIYIDNVDVFGHFPIMNALMFTRKKHFSLTQLCFKGSAIPKEACFCKLSNSATCIFSFHFIRYVYWTDWGREPGIERISMDGDATTRQHLISTNVVWPNALTLDYAQNKMYWMDAKLGRLEVANMDGSDRLLLILSNLDSPFSMTNFEDKIYWTSWRKNEIKIASKFNEANIVKRVSSNHISPLGIKVFHPLQQPSGKVLNSSIFFWT